MKGVYESCYLSDIQTSINSVQCLQLKYHIWRPKLPCCTYEISRKWRHIESDISTQYIDSWKCTLVSPTWRQELCSSTFKDEFLGEFCFKTLLLMWTAAVEKRDFLRKKTGQTLKFTGQKIVTI